MTTAEHVHNRAADSGGVHGESALPLEDGGVYESLDCGDHRCVGRAEGDALQVDNVEGAEGGGCVGGAVVYAFEDCDGGVVAAFAQVEAYVVAHVFESLLLD